jgi:hypothetical protein
MGRIEKPSDREKKDYKEEYNALVTARRTKFKPIHLEVDEEFYLRLKIYLLKSGISMKTFVSSAIEKRLDDLGV